MAGHEGKEKHEKKKKRNVKDETENITERNECVEVNGPSASEGKTPEWTDKLEHKLVKRVGRYLKEEENKGKLLKQVDWNQIKVANFSAKRLHAKYIKLVYTVRKSRTAWEIHSDLLELPKSKRAKQTNKDKPKLFNAYGLFVQEVTPKIKQKFPGIASSKYFPKVAEMWHDLSEKEKSELEKKSETLQVEYNNRMIAYLIKNPTLPVKKLPLPPAPKKPPQSGHFHFCQETANEDPEYYNSSLTFKERNRILNEKWKDLTKAEKELWKEKVKKMKGEYGKEYEKYLESLTPEQREVLYSQERIKKERKRKASENNVQEIIQDLPPEKRQKWKESFKV